MLVAILFGTVDVSQVYRRSFSTRAEAVKFNYTFKVKGVMCEGCLQSIEKSLRKIDNVVGMEYDWKKRLLKVWYVGVLDPESVEKAVSDAGYECERVDYGRGTP